MNLEQMRNRCKEVINQLKGFQNVENLSAENIEEINKLKDEYSDLKNKIEAKVALDDVLNDSSMGTRQVVNHEINNVGGDAAKNRQTQVMQNGGFTNMGEFFKAVVTGQDPRFKNAAFEKNGEDGGFLIPEDYRAEIQKKVQSDEALISRTRQFITSSNHLTLPVSETAPWDGNGITAYWESEGALLRESKAKFGLATWRLHKLTVLVPVTDELLEDAPALESWIKQVAPEAIQHKTNNAIINGSGDGQPLGILKSDYTITVPKESGQAADSIVYQNLVKMDARLIGDGVWIAHAGLKEQLRLLKDDNGNVIYMNGQYFPNLSAKPFDTLLGKPIIYMAGSMRAPGDRGDLVLANLNHYITAMKSSGVRQDMSTHVYFDRDLTAFRFIFRVAGQTPYKAPVTTEYGNYQMSAFVALEDRA